MELQRQTAVSHATGRDVPAIAEVHLEAWQSTYRDTPLHKHLDSQSAAHREEIWTKLLARYADGVRLWVATRDAAIVGFLATGPVRPPRKAGPREVEVYALYQRRAVERSGVAHRLVAHTLEDLRNRGFGDVHLSAMASNQRARAFYERHGWLAAAEETFDYHGAEIRQISYRRAI